MREGSASFGDGCRCVVGDREEVRVGRRREDGHVGRVGTRDLRSDWCHWCM